MRLNRRIVNLIRFVLEDLLPPALRDSRLFFPLMRLAFGRNAGRFAEFRKEVLHMTTQDYAWHYRTLVPVMGESDLNRACLDSILRDIVGESVLDVGCGRGFLVRRVAAGRAGRRVAGIDIDPPAPADGIAYVAGRAEALPFADGAFDTVLCTHTLEHVLDLERALAELRRVARRRLIVVVPREREYRYSFNFHLHFFPYEHSFLNRVRPRPGYRCETLGGDIYFVEDRPPSAQE